MLTWLTRHTGKLIGSVYAKSLQRHDDGQSPGATISATTRQELEAHFAAASPSRGQRQGPALAAAFANEAASFPAIVATARDLLGFLTDRLKVHLRETGARHDLIDAVLLGGQDDLALIVKGVEALDQVLHTDDVAHLLIGGLSD